MKLNPSKCAFGVSLGKFLGFMVSHRGIEANPDKIQVILDMEPPCHLYNPLFQRKTLLITIPCFKGRPFDSHRVIFIHTFMSLFIFMFKGICVFIYLWLHLIIYLGCLRTLGRDQVNL